VLDCNCGKSTGDELSKRRALLERFERKGAASGTYEPFDFSICLGVEYASATNDISLERHPDILVHGQSRVFNCEI
jgi:hypothetical protein